jgi:branched-chain amino acid transport system substrate-binding protein
MMGRLCESMARTLFLGAVISLLAIVPAARAAEVKIGLIAAFTGPYSVWGTQYRQGIELYFDKYGNKLGSDTLSVIYRDEGGINPARAKQLAQELIVRDDVAVLAGQTFTPNVMAIADVVTEAKVPFVVFNAGTSNAVLASPYYVRIGGSQSTLSYIAARWALEQNFRSCDIAVADYAAGQDAAEGYAQPFVKGGGKVIETVAVPLSTTDYSSYVQRIRDASPQCVFMFMPTGGPMPAAFMKAFAESGLRNAGIRLIGGTETQEYELPSIGDAALGVNTAAIWSPNLDNPTNREFVAAYHAKFGKETIPGMMAAYGYDGMRVIVEMLKATGGKRDAEKAIAAVLGFAWDSPRGRVSIYPKSHDIVESVYVREVVKENGVLVNKILKTYPEVRDPRLE